MAFTKFRFFAEGARFIHFVDLLPTVQIFQAYGTTNYVADHMRRNSQIFFSVSRIYLHSWRSKRG